MYYYLDYETSDEISKYNENILREFDTYSDMARYIETHSSKGYGCLIPVHTDEISNVTQYLFVPMDKVITRLDEGKIRMTMVLKGDNVYPLGMSTITIDTPEKFYPIHLRSSIRSSLILIDFDFSINYWHVISVA